MAAELPYLQSYARVDRLFDRIKSAKKPDAFTHKFLYDTIGLKNVVDRAFIPLLRTLGFIDPSGKPTPEYGSLKNEAQAPRAIAAAIRRAYGPLFEANENAYKLPQDQLKGLVAQVAGSDASTTSKIVGTFNALAKLADFSAAAPVDKSAKGDEETKKDDEGERSRRGPGIRPEFHYNIQIHLPANGTEETYLNIFNALRKALA